MKNETLKRILHLMEQGVITAEEAADLIDALYDTGGYASEEKPAQEPSENGQTETARSLFDKIARAVEEAAQSATEAVRKVDWRAIGDTIRHQTQRGLEEMRKALAELERTDWSLGKWGKHHAETHQEMALPMSAGQTLAITLPAGDIHITGGFDGGRVEATIHLRGADPDALQEALRAYSLLVEQTPEGVRLSAPELEPQIAHRVDLTLSLPREINLIVQLQRGDITIEKIDGTVQLKTRHGDIAVRHTTGAIEAETLHGDLTLTDVQAPRARLHALHGDLHLSHARIEQLQANLTHGDILIEDAAIATLKAETVKGDMEIDLTEPIRDTVHLNAVSGDITLRVPDDNDCTVAMRTVAGDIECDLECRSVERDFRSLQGVCGEGKGALIMETVHGDLCVELRSHPTE